jgi:hypothetical protein
MTALLFFLIGIVTALLYFGHLYWQLKHLSKGSGRMLLLGFTLRFALLCLWFGALFWADAPMAVFAVAGMVAGRFGLQYAVYAKKGL